MKCLLVGNGINLLSRNGQSWQQVLRDLARKADKEQIIMELSEHKPFTLIYEEISLRSHEFNGTKEIELKKYVASLVKQIEPNMFHERFIDSNIKNIITTNYDYSFEKSCRNYSSQKANLARETKYSNFRRRVINNTNVWHIHGEADVPNSITLGHEQYSGTIQKMRNYLTGDRENTGGPVSPFKCGIANFENESEVYSWLDIFLRDEVHIVGFGLDYTEIDLWWLLSYKARIRQKRGNSLHVGETYFHHFYDRTINDKERAKHLILKSLGVKVQTKNVNGDFQQAYNDFLNQ